MSAQLGHLAGHFSEMGWSESEADGGLRLAARSALLMCVTGGYFGVLWLSSGLAPVAFVISHMTRIRRHRAG